MSKCLYPYCTLPDARQNYFCVPVDVGLRKKWMSSIPQVLNLTQGKLNRTDVFLCSKHFDKSCFTYDKNGKRIGIREDAVPSIFYIPSKPIKEEDEDFGEMNIPPPPPIPPAMSAATLSAKAQQEVLRMLILKEQLAQEEEEFVKSRDQLQRLEKSNKTEEIQEAYVNVMKKMRPIAPKKPQKKKPKTLEDVIVYMRKERLISDEAGLVLMNLFADVCVQDVLQSAGSKEGYECFAQYMTFYDTELYENLCSHFDINFPTIALIRNLFNPAPGEPGWSQDAFNCVKQKAKSLKGGSKLLCSLLVGTMSIKRKEEWDGKRMRGYVDCGPSSQGFGFDMDTDGLPTARSVLVLMAVPLDPHQLWRVPVAYFYVNMLTSKEKANVIRESILRLHGVGAVVLSVTCNVCWSEKTFLNSLGMSLDVLPQICPYFVNPADPLLRVHLIFDDSSLLTSVLNMWACSKDFLDGEGEVISWKFVSELIRLQEAQAGSYTQTMDCPHWTWDSIPVRNRLMAQLFSESSADAIEFCSQELGLIQFIGCEGTVKFIRAMSKIRKLLNSRRYLKNKSSGFDDVSIRSDFNESLEYLYNLKNKEEQHLQSTNPGSFRLLYQTLLSSQELLRQVPELSTHCLSLDEVELVFYLIRASTGWSSIPTARQFTAAFSAHVQKCGYLNFWSLVKINDHWWIDSLDISTARKEGYSILKPELKSPCAPPTNCKSFSVNKFIAVNIVKTLANVLHCGACLEALQDAPSSDNALLRFLRRTCGAALCPSQDVLRICSLSEHHLQTTLKTSSINVKTAVFEWKIEKISVDIGTALVREVLENDKKLFSCLQQHSCVSPPNSSHLYRLIVGISYCYVQTRLRSLESWCPI